jgi:hypothetical protein
MTRTKRCNACGQIKSIDEFWVRKSGKDKGYALSYCKACGTAQMRERYRQDPERMRERSRIYRDTHPDFAERNRQQSRQWASANREKIQASGRQYRCGITPAEYERMLEEQKGICAICGKGVTLHIDHDHACCPSDKKRTCGRCIRGLLCGACNQGLGFFKDNPDLLLAAIDYLAKWAQRTEEVR